MSESTSESTPALGRREFLRCVTVAGIGATVVGREALAQAVAPAAPSPAAPPAAADSTAAAEPPPSEDALALAGILRRRYPDRLTALQWAGVTRGLEARLDSGRRLRARALANGDEPDFAFRP